MAGRTYAELAPIVYRLAEDGDKLGVNRIYDGAPVQTSPRLRRQLLALLQVLSAYNLAGARLALAAIQRESTGWNSLQQHAAQESNVFVSPVPARGEAADTLARSVREVLESGRFGYAWITGGGVAHFTTSPGASERLARHLGSDYVVHVLNGGTLRCESVLALLDAARQWEQGHRSKQVIVGPMYAAPWWLVSNAPSITDPATLVPPLETVAVVHLGPSPLDVWLNSLALLTRCPGHARHWYIVEPDTMCMDTADCNRLLSGALNSEELQQICWKAAVQYQGLFEANGTGRRYVGPPEDLQFGDCGVAAASLMAGERDETLDMLKRARNDSARKAVHAAHDSIKWARGRLPTEAADASSDRAAFASENSGILSKWFRSVRGNKK